MSARRLREDEVYVGAKALLHRLGWTVIAGQPPAGCDHLPVVEVKAPKRDALGSLGAYKPDLVAVRETWLLLVECKPLHDDADAAKLRAVIHSGERRATLLSELHQRRLLGKRGFSESTSFSLLGALAHSGPVRLQVDLVVLSVLDVSGNGTAHVPADPAAARSLFTL